MARLWIHVLGISKTRWPGEDGPQNLTYCLQDGESWAMNWFKFPIILHQPLSEPFFRTLDSFVLQKIFPSFFPVRLFNSETIFGFGWSFQKGFVHHYADMISAGGSNWRVSGQLGIASSESFVDKFPCRHCWATCAVCAQPHASHWICHSVWQQSVAVFNKIGTW